MGWLEKSGLLVHRERWDFRLAAVACRPAPAVKHARVEVCVLWKPFACWGRKQLWEIQLTRPPLRGGLSFFSLKSSTGRGSAGV